LETLSWGRLDPYLTLAEPALLKMGGTRGVQIGFEPANQRLFLRAPLEEGATVPASPYGELTLEAKRVGRSAVMEVSATSARLYREFHRLAGLLTEELERPGQTAVGAFLAVAERWRGLTAMRELLGPEEQLGLFGELAVLQGLIRECGPDAVASWTARVTAIPERHDFRVGQIDIEVKTTRTAVRNHIIHGLRQLEPCAGHTLFLISLKFAAAGMKDGRSLVDRVRTLRESLSMSPQSLTGFESRLDVVGYRDTDAVHYQERLIVADVPMAIPVDADCPRIVPSSIRETMGTELANRIDNDVTYRINVEGLGRPLKDARDAGPLVSLLIE
jgi:hypothetical protein